MPSNDPLGILTSRELKNNTDPLGILMPDEGVSFELPFEAKHPTLYATGRTIADLIPFGKYAFEEERKEFGKLKQQEQTRRLLEETAEAELFLGFPRLLKGVGEVAGGVTERFFPKTHEFFTKPLGKAKPKIKPTEEPIEEPIITEPPIKPKETSLVDQVLETTTEDPLGILKPEEKVIKPTPEPTPEPQLGAKAEVGKVAKKPWEMTREDFFASGKEIPGHPHIDYVREALSEGKPVPPEVLKDYPDLVKTQLGAKAEVGKVAKKPWEMTREELQNELSLIEQRRRETNIVLTEKEWARKEEMEKEIDKYSAKPEEPRTIKDIQDEIDQHKLDITENQKELKDLAGDTEAQEEIRDAIRNSKAEIADLQKELKHPDLVKAEAAKPLESLAEFKDYRKVWEAFRDGNIKEGVSFKVKAYGGIDAVIKKAEPPYDIDALGLPKKYTIEEIKPQLGAKAEGKPDVTEAFPIEGETFEQAKTRYEKHFGDYPFDLDLVKKTAEENKGISISVDSLNEMYYDKITGKKLTPSPAKAEAAKPLEPLAKEARKYGSAEEFAQLNSRDIIKHIDNLPLTEQIKLDIQLHDRYIETSKNKKNIDFYKKDSIEKQKILDIIEGKNKNPDEIQKAIDVLTKDQELHKVWATKGGSFGGKEWNNKWINIYDNWKSQLTDIYNQAKPEGVKGGGTTLKSGLETLAEEERRIDQSGKISLGKDKTKEKLYSFDNPETESLYKSAIIQPEKLSSRVKNLLTEVKHKFTRTYEHLSESAENANLIFDLKRLEKQKEVSADRSARTIGETLSTLDKKDSNILARKVFLDDLMDDVNRGLYNEKDLPFKFTSDSLRKELQKIEGEISTNPRLQEALVKRRNTWDALKAEYIRELEPYKPDVADMFKKESYYRHEVLDYMVEKGIFGTGKQLKTPYRGYMRERTGYSGLYNTDFLSAEHNIMSQMLYDIETAKTLTRIKNIEDIAGKLKKIAKDTGVKDWQTLIPEGYTTWQPREGNVFYRTLSVPEATMQKIMEGELADIAELTPELKQVLAMGGKRKEWVVREEIAKTLDNLVKERSTGILSRADLNIMTAWKKWQLISPRRYFKYNARNLTGDAEAVFLGNSSGFKKAPQAVRELWNVFVEKKPMTEDMSAWFERGGMSSTLQAQEMDALKKSWVFTRLYEKKGDFNLWKKYWNAARMSTDLRESILRYANFLDYKEQMLINKGIPKNYGASKPEMINALKSINDKAFWLQNDLLGAYDRISVAGGTIRERIFPFWSWQEINAKRYIQFYKNAASDGNLTMTIGKQLGVKSPLMAMKIGRLALKTSAFVGLLQVYNNLLFPNEEKVLPNDIKSNAHIILGKDEKGDILYFNRMGMLDDFISWFGLDYVPLLVNRVLKGEPLKDLLKEQATKTLQAPINKVAQGAFPFTKLAFETLTRRGTFPDIFKQGTVRDRWLHVARSFGLENEYIAMAGKPTKGYGESLKNLILYTINPGEAAYRNTWDMKHRFLKKLGKGAEGFWLTTTGDALYNMKLAMRYKDKEAFSKYFSTYVFEASKQGRDVESIQKGLNQSLLNMHPLAGLKPEELKAFAQTLSEDEKETVDNAIKFYMETLKPKG